MRKRLARLSKQQPFDFQITLQKWTNAKWTRSGIKLSTLRLLQDTTKSQLRNRLDRESNQQPFDCYIQLQKCHNAETSISWKKPAIFRLLSPNTQRRARESNLQHFNYHSILQEFNGKESNFGLKPAALRILCPTNCKNNLHQHHKTIFCIKCTDVYFLGIFRHIEFLACYWPLLLKLPLCYLPLIGTI